MKVRKYLFVLLVFFFLLGAGSFYFWMNNNYGEIDLMKSCIKQGGEWLSQYQECERVSVDWCEENGGRFFECADACRHFTEQVQCKHPCFSLCEFNY